MSNFYKSKDTDRQNGHLTIQEVEKVDLPKSAEWFRTVELSIHIF